MLLLLLFPLTYICRDIYYAESIPYAPTHEALGLPECQHKQIHRKSFHIPLDVCATITLKNS